MSSSSSARPGTPNAASIELARHVLAWRRRLDPATVSGRGPGWSGTPRRRWVSQEQIAQLIGCSTQWYSRLELGYLENYSDEFVATVARVLLLSPDETRLLSLLAGKGLPAPAARTAAPGGLERLWQAQPWASYLSDQAWDVIGYNEPMRHAFPWVQHAGANIMKWVFLDPDARQQLHRWDTDWAPQMLAQLRVAHLQHPDNQRLTYVVREILATSVDVQRLWQQPIAYFHPDGDRRLISLPSHDEPPLVQITELEPLGLPGHRLVVLVPEPPP